MSDITQCRSQAQRLSTTATILVTLGLLATPVDFAVSIWMQGLAPLLPGLPTDQTFDLSQASVLGTAALVLVAALHPGTFMVALWQLRRLFRLYRQGTIFRGPDIRCLQRIGWSLVALDLVRTLQQVLVGPVLALDGVGSPFLSIGLGISYALIGLFVIVIARIMEIGRALREFEELAV